MKISNNLLSKKIDTIPSYLECNFYVDEVIINYTCDDYNFSIHAIFNLLNMSLRGAEFSLYDDLDEEISVTLTENNKDVIEQMFLNFIEEKKENEYVINESFKTYLSDLGEVSFYIN